MKSKTTHTTATALVASKSPKQTKTAIKVQGLSRHARRKDDVKYRWANFRSQAKRRGISVSLSLLEYLSIIVQPCAYCGGRHNMSAFNGIDRVDSDGEYTSANTVACCKACNFMKGPMKKREFLSQVDAIHHHHASQRAPAQFRDSFHDPFSDFPPDILPNSLPISPHNPIDSLESVPRASITAARGPLNTTSHLSITASPC